MPQQTIRSEAVAQPSPVSIELENVCVSFPTYSTAHRSMRHALVKATTGGLVGVDVKGARHVQALNMIDLQLKRGDRLALIGHNGAGKTTLLRVLAQIYEPVTGRVEIKGRVAPLFDIGLGMSPDATGYENIRIRGLYLGLTSKEIEARLDEIADFTELGTFLDMPLRTYSLGMQMRLAFAVSTAIDPEILLLDEGIGAGDANFIAKANARLDAFVARAGILVLSTHVSELVTRFCNSAVVLEKGEIVYRGTPAEALAHYHAGRSMAGG
ncbi:MAG: ABC transporter ATP-binding protein [Rhabdaerophilum sp.]